MNQLVNKEQQLKTNTPVLRRNQIMYKKQSTEVAQLDESLKYLQK